LRRRLAAGEVIEKIHFAAPREAAFAAALSAAGIDRVVVAGMEAHVCVQQTVLALLARGLAVTVAGDAVASRRDLDRRVALARLARAGAALADTAALLDAWSDAPVPLPPPAG
jgi:nicotinamidase-related amidase